CGRARKRAKRTLVGLLDETLRWSWLSKSCRNTEPVLSASRFRAVSPCRRGGRGGRSPLMKLGHAGSSTEDGSARHEAAPLHGVPIYLQSTSNVSVFVRCHRFHGALS